MSTRTIGRTAQGARRPRTAAGAVLTLVVLTVAGYAGAPSASAYSVHNHAVTATGSATDTGTASVIGTVSMKTSPPGSPADVVVTLTEIPASGDSLTRKTKSDARGGFAFRDLAGGADWSYVVAATYAGTIFESNTVQVEGGKIIDVPLPLYPSTTSNAKITETAWAVWVDMTGNTMAVQQDVALKNTGTAAYTGSTQVPGTPAGLDKAAFTLPVVPGAANLQYLGHFQSCCGAIEGTTWSHTRPISPGVVTGTLRYETPFVSSLTFPVTLPTADFSMIVPQSLTVTSAQLTKSGTNNDQGVIYDVYKATGALAVGTIVTVTLSQGGAATSSGIAWWLIALVVVVLVVVILGLWLLVRRRHSGQVDADAQAPATKASAGKASAGTASSGKASGKNKSKARASKSEAKDTAATSKHAKAAQSPTTATGAAAAAAAGVAVATQAEPEPEPAPAPEATAAVATPEPAAVEPEPAATVDAPTAPSTNRADQLTDELATLDLAWENGTITDEGAYRRIRESLVARLVAEVESTD